MATRAAAEFSHVLQRVHAVMTELRARELDEVEVRRRQRNKKDPQVELQPDVYTSVNGFLF